MSDIIEQAARVLSTLTTCDGEPNATELHRRQALALAGAGLLAQSRPEPDWLDAPAVLAAMNECSWQKVWFPSTTGYWTCSCCGAVKHWTDMADVTPLYPKEDA